MQARPLTM